MSHHLFRSYHNTASHSFHQSLAIEGIVIVEHHAGCTLLHLDMDGQLEFCRILSQALQTFETRDIQLSDNTQLVFIDNLWSKAIVGSNTSKRIFLVFYHTAEHLGTLTNKLRHRLVSNSDTQWQRIDKHTEGVGSTHIATTITDGRQIATVIARIACYRIEGGCQHQGCRRDTLLTGIVAYRIHIKRRTGNLHHSFGLLTLQVGSQFTGTLEVCQHRSIVLTVCLEVFRSLKAFLVGYKIEIGIALFLDGSALKCSA